MKNLILAVTIACSVVPLTGAHCAAGDVTASYTWRCVQRPKGEQWTLRKDGKQIGVWVVREQRYYPLLPLDVWGEPTAPPIAPPSEAIRELPNFGVSAERAGPKYRINGKAVSRDAVLDAVRTGGVPDTSGKRRITVIGSAEERQRALAAIGKPGWAVVTDWSPDAWQVAECGFDCTGHPSVYVQEPDGRVLHRQADDKDLIAAIRRADPTYDAKQDPDLRSGPAIGPGHPASFVVGGGLGALVTLALRWGLPAVLSWLTLRRKALTDAQLAALVAAVATHMEKKSDAQKSVG